MFFSLDRKKCFQSKQFKLVNYLILLISKLIVTVTLIFFSRNLNDNELKDLPAGVFDQNTDLRRL